MWKKNYIYIIIHIYYLFIKNECIHFIQSVRVVGFLQNRGRQAQGLFWLNGKSHQHKWVKLYVSSPLWCMRAPAVCYLSIHTVLVMEIMGTWSWWSYASWTTRLTMFGNIILSRLYKRLRDKWSVDIGRKGSAARYDPARKVYRNDLVYVKKCNKYIRQEHKH